MDSIELKEKAKYLRQQAFEMVISAGKGHLGGSLSCTEILVALYYGGITIEVNPSRLRPSDVTLQIPCIDKFVKVTGWKPEIKLGKTRKIR